MNRIYFYTIARYPSRILRFRYLITMRTYRNFSRSKGHNSRYCISTFLTGFTPFSRSHCQFTIRNFSSIRNTSAECSPVCSNFYIYHTWQSSAHTYQCITRICNCNRWVTLYSRLNIRTYYIKKNITYRFILQFSYSGFLKTSHLDGFELFIYIRHIEIICNPMTSYVEITYIISTNVYK